MSEQQTLTISTSDVKAVVFPKGAMIRINGQLWRVVRSTGHSVTVEPPTWRQRQWQRVRAMRARWYFWRVRHVPVAPYFLLLCTAVCAACLTVAMLRPRPDLFAVVVCALSTGSSFTAVVVWYGR